MSTFAISGISRDISSSFCEILPGFFVSFLQDLRDYSPGFRLIFLRAFA